MAEKLSPTAQAVYDAATIAAIRDNADWPVAIAAALRAAVEQCAGLPDGRDCTELLRSIATELENTDD